MADPKISKAPEVQPAPEAKPTPEPPRVEPFIPGRKQFPRALNGKQTGAWKIRDHEGKIVHATDDPDEAVFLIKMFGLNGPGDENEDYPGRYWAILPHDPRKLKDKSYQKDLERRRARAGK
jgi:hypothetical protein